jgi:hypothetical protein
VFTRLGGKFVGWVAITEECTTLVSRVRDLQRQVARIFKHPTRASKYLKLFVDNFELPSYTYHDKCHFDIELEATFKLLKLFGNLVGDRAPVRLECMYDEDDSQTLKVLQRMYSAQILDSPHYIHTSAGDLRQELRVLKHTHDPKQVDVVHRGYPCLGVVDLSALASFTNLTSLAIRGFIVLSWEFAKHLPLKRLELDVCEFPSLERKYFESLEELIVWLNNQTNFELLERPVNLKTITFLGNTAPSSDTLRSLSTIFPDLHVVGMTNV